MQDRSGRASYFSFGNVAIDDLVYADGTTRWGVPGGGAMYAALGMALWSSAAAVVAPVGSDYPRDGFATVDFSHCSAVAHTMRNWGLYESDGSRHFLSRRDSLPWEAFSTDPRELDAGPYPFCHVAPMPMERVAAVVDGLNARGTRLISLDLHDRELAAFGFDVVAALVERVHIFLPSRQDADALFPGHAPLDALRSLRAQLPHVRILGVKCGAQGALVHAAGSAEVILVPSAADVVVDATGAGDAFCGGFLAGYAQREDPIDGALHGAVAASFAVAAFGPEALASGDANAARARLSALRARITSVPLRAS